MELLFPSGRLLILNSSPEVGQLRISVRMNLEAQPVQHLPCPL